MDLAPPPSTVARRVCLAALAVGWLALAAFAAFLALYPAPPRESGFVIVALLVGVARVTLAVAIPALAVGVCAGALALRRDRGSQRPLLVVVIVSAVVLLGVIAEASAALRG